MPSSRRALLLLAISALSQGAVAASTAAADPTEPAPGASDFAVAGKVWTSPALPADATATAEQENTLAGVYALALKNDPVLEAAEATWRAGREEKRIGFAGLLPQAQASYSGANVTQKSRGSFAAGTQVFPNQNDSDVNNTSWSLSLSQPLFDLGAWFSFQRGKELTEQARATFTQAQQDLIVRVVNGYADVLRARANLSASRAQEKALAAQLEQVQQRFDVGLVAITDVLDAEAAHDTAVASRVADAAALDVALELLTVITGQHHAQVWPLREKFPVVDPTPDSADDWLDFALANNVDLTVSKLGSDAALQAARSTASQHLPTVSLTASRSYNASNIYQKDLVQNVKTPFERKQHQDTIAVEISMPLFTGGRLSAQRRQAYARYDSSERNYEAVRRNVTQSTRALYINVKRDVARTRARARAITSTRSALDAAQVGYQVGTRNVVDVLNAQRAVYSAIRDHDNSIVDYIQDVVALKRQAGILTPEDVLELNTWLEKPQPITASERGDLSMEPDDPVPPRTDAADDMDAAPDEDATAPAAPN